MLLQCPANPKVAIVPARSLVAKLDPSHTPLLLMSLLTRLTFRVLLPSPSKYMSKCLADENQISCSNELLPPIVSHNLYAVTKALDISIQ
jgi:hypothetical protein